MKREMTQEHRDAIGARMKEAWKTRRLTPFSEETRAKMSRAKKGTLVALNIETGITTRIPVEEYHSHREIYIHGASKILRNVNISIYK